MQLTRRAAKSPNTASSTTLPYAQPVPGRRKRRKKKRESVLNWQVVFPWLLLTIVVLGFYALGAWWISKRSKRPAFDQVNQFPVSPLSDESESTVPFRITALDETDFRGFTVRINTWKREEHLKYSIMHHSKCRCIRQIQVVWCLDQGEPPAFLRDFDKVVVERHPVNSLNERFNILVPPPTKGILSIDDDIIRPCIAYEAGFRKWLQYPTYQVGFDARTHTDSLQYGYMSTTERTNHYSFTLTRCSLQHVDYLYSYMDTMPATIRDRVADNFNCEDIAMSLWISKHARSVPLLADFWAVKSQIKLYVDSKISDGANHKSLRDDCVRDFTQTLDISPERAKLKHKSLMEYGKILAERDLEFDFFPETKKTLDRWRQDSEVLMAELADLRADASRDIYAAGLLEGSPPWKRRFRSERAGQEEEEEV